MVIESVRYNGIKPRSVLGSFTKVQIEAIGIDVVYFIGCFDYIYE